jgi:hypothetical protein
LQVERQVTITSPPLTVNCQLNRPLLKAAARAGGSPAPDTTVTVAPFRAWRGSRLIVAEKPTRATIKRLGDFEGRGLYQK